MLVALTLLVVTRFGFRSASSFRRGSRRALSACRLPTTAELPVVSLRKRLGDVLFMRENGTVKFFNQAKGYGFISPDGGGKDVFVHITAVQRSGIPELAENMKLSFEIQPDKKGRGPQAVNLQLV
jgi:cold shock protein